MAIQKKTTLIKKLIAENFTANQKNNFFIVTSKENKGIVFYLFKDPNLVTKIYVTDKEEENYTEKQDLYNLQPNTIEYIFRHRTMVRGKDILKFVKNKLNIKWVNLIYQAITGLEPKEYKLSENQIKELTI